MKKILVFLMTLAIIFNISINQGKAEAIKQYEMAGTLQLGLTLPTGDWSDFWGTSFGVLGTYEYKITPEIATLVSLGFIQWSQLNETYEDYNYYSIPIQVAGHYYFAATKDFRPYGGLELGVHMMKMEVDHHGYKQSSINDSYFAVSPLVGALIPFGQDDFYLNANVKYSTIMTEGSSRAYFALWAGITYPF